MTTAKDQKIFGLSLGAEPKKVIALGGLLLVLAVVWFMTRDSSDSAGAPSSASSSAKAPAGLKGIADTDATVPGSRATGRPGGPKRQGSRQALTAAVKEFHPSLKPDKDNPIDPSKTDPTIHFTSLSKVQGVGMAGGGRSLFDFGPMMAAADPSKPVIVSKPTRIIPVYGPAKPEAIPPAPPPPPPPAIPLKFYGFVNSARSGEKRAFFMENEDIYIASEGETMKGRYKLVKIGVNSVVLEDMQYKNNQQTIKLTEEATSTN